MPCKRHITLKMSYFWRVFNKSGIQPKIGSQNNIYSRMPLKLKFKN